MLGAARLTTKNLTPSYAIGLGAASTNEGPAGGYLNVSASIYFNEESVGETIYWEILPVSGSITSNDFEFNTGSIILTGTSPKSFNIGVKGDSLTEGTESFSVRIRKSTSIGTILGVSNAVVINDTSTNATYTMTSPLSTTFLNEGNSSVTFNVSTTNVPNGQILPWRIRQTGSGNLTGSDFTIGSLTGSLTINNNSGSLTLTTVADNLFEGSEYFYLDVYKMDGSIFSSPLIGINDTSDGGASLKVNPDVYNYGEYLKLALPFRQSTQFNDIAYTFYESTQNVAATKTGPTGVVISSSGQKFYDGAFIADGTQTPPKYVTTTALNTSGQFCIMFWAKTSSSNWNNWVLGNNASGLTGETGIALSTYNNVKSPNNDNIRLISNPYDAQLITSAGGGAEGRIGGLASNTWYHFAFTKTGWWVNGQYKGTISWAGGSWNTNGIIVGGAYYTSGGFSGGLQDFRVYVGNNILADYTSFTPPGQMIAT